MAALDKKPRATAREGDEPSPRRNVRLVPIPLTPPSRGVVPRMGRIVLIDTTDGVGIAFSGEDSVLYARSVQPIDERDIGAEVFCLFNEGKPEQPIIVGKIQPIQRRATRQVLIEDESIVLDGRSRVEIRCGEASLVLTRDGKAVLKGLRVVTDAKGVNRIRGGSVQIN